MSFWTDIRDTITAPVRALGQYVEGVVDGRNVFDATKQFAAQEIAAAQGPSSFIGTIPVVQSTLKALDPYTLGITGDMATLFSQSKKINTGETDSGSVNTELDTFGRLGIKAGALYAGGAAVGFTGSASQIGGAALVSKGFSQGGLGGALGAGISNFAPTEVQGYLGFLGGAAGAKAASQSAPLGGVGLDNNNSSTYGYYEPDNSSQSSISPIVIGAVALATIFILKRKKHV